MATYNPIIIDKKQSINVYHIYTQLTQLFNLKNVLIQQFKCIIQNKVCIITINLFYSFSCIGKLLKKTKYKFKPLIYPSSSFLFKNIVFNNKLAAQNNFRKIVTKYTVLTIKKKKSKNLKFLCQQIVNRLLKLFKTRKHLILDFTRLLLLLLKGYSVISLSTFYLSKMFSILPKKKHNQFFSILKKLFTFLMSDKAYKLYTVDLNSTRRISGIKFRFAGRIRGKTRSDIKHITLGVTPLQGDQNKMEYSMRHIFTKFGTFGLKTTLYY